MLVGAGPRRIGGRDCRLGLKVLLLALSMLSLELAWRRWPVVGALAVCREYRA